MRIPQWWWDDHNPHAAHPGLWNYRRSKVKYSEGLLLLADEKLQWYYGDKLQHTQREIGWFWLIRLYHVHMINMAMDQYLYIPFLVGWTSIYQLFWCSPGVQGFDTLPYHPKIIQESPQLSNIHPKITQQSSNSHANFLRKIIPTKISNIILHK
jgi:hypothetical protein